MKRTTRPLRVWLPTASLAFMLTRAAVALALLLLGLSPASGAAAQAPLTAEDLGPEWFFAGEIWGDEEPGTALAYAASFGRDPLQGLSGRGPILVTLGIELLTETPAPDAVDRGIAVFLESLDDFLGPLGPGVDVSFFDGPTVGTNPKWVRFGVNLGTLVPETLPPPGVAYGVGFEAGTNTAGVVTIGFLEQTTPEDTAAIARIVAERLQEIRRPAG